MRKPNLVFMYGEDSFSLSQELDRWKSMFIKKYEGDMNLEELSGNVDPAKIAASIGALPFLAEKRLVILKDFLKSNKAEERKTLLPIIENVPDSTVLVIAESEQPDKRSSVFKALNKEATVRLFEKPKGYQLSVWAMRRAEKHGGLLDQRIADFLVSQVGSDLWRLDHETQKLSLYAQGKPITMEMITALVKGNVERSIFTMTDQLAAKDIAGALKTMRELQEQGEEAPYLFAMLARQFRLMLEMKDLQESRTPPNVIASKMKVHPFVVKNTLRQCNNFTHKQLNSALKQLLEIDRRLKTGRIHLRPREEAHYLLALEQILIAQK